MLRTPTTKYHGEQFMEDNGLLPQNQHGFRAGGSAMSALSAIQQEWADNTEEDRITGILSSVLPDLAFGAIWAIF